MISSLTLENTKRFYFELVYESYIDEKANTEIVKWHIYVFFE